MNPTQDFQYRQSKGKKTTTSAGPPSANVGPTTFFLRSERELAEKSVQRGRKTSRDSVVSSEDSIQTATPMMSMMSDSAFGVQSLEDTVGSTLSSSEHSLSRTNSNVSDAGIESNGGARVLAGRKRKAGNPVHPNIIATGQRILSADHNNTYQQPHSESPVSHHSAESPLRSGLAGRRNSVSSSINLSRPLTPLKMSPRPSSIIPSTPRSASPKSFRLSDEEQSIASDAGSQAVVSSNGENEEEVSGKSSSMPQLVMPSISIPTRRPFTEKGKRMGRMKIMVVGPEGVGKTSLIQSICRVCEDVVHMDALSMYATGASDAASSNRRVVEVGASTRPYPSWWTDFESRRMLLRRKNTGEGVLERNLTFIDTPGIGHSNTDVDTIRHHLTSELSRTASMGRWNDSELIHVLSGDGGVLIDAVIYLFAPESSTLDEKEVELLRYLSKWTNVVPLVGKADMVSAEDLTARKKELSDLFATMTIESCFIRPSDEFTGEGDAASGEPPAAPYAVSSALGDDAETIDASVLMASGYLQPLVPSELEFFLERFLEPDNIARLRHLSATKFLLWRQENLGIHIDTQKPSSLQQNIRTDSPAITDSLLLASEDDASKVLVPHASSTYFRSTSPSASESSALSNSDKNVTSTSTQALARYNDQLNTGSSIPFRQVRLAKWAQDLQRSLDNERRRYRRMFASPSSGSEDSDPRSARVGAEDSEKGDPSTSLVTHKHSRPAKGHLGGEVGIIDPRDPLGVLAFGQAFSRRGWFALQVAGSCGALGAIMWWVVRNWEEVVEFLRPAAQETQPAIRMTGVHAPTETSSWLGDLDWRNLLGWER